MDDLIAFLNARLGEDEAPANSLFFAARIPDKRPDFTACGGPAAEVYWDHFNPARVLREVAAKRTFLRWFTSAEGEPLYMLLDQTPEELGRGGGTVLRGEWILREMAAVYSDHPDYRGEWAP